MRLEGIEAYRVILHSYTDNAIDNLGQYGYGSHAIIALRASDGRFYYCDVEQSATGSDQIYEKYHQLLVTAKEQHPYSNSIDRIWNHLDYATEMPMELFWNHLSYRGQGLFIEDEEGLLALLREYIASGAKDSQINVFQYGESDLVIEDVLDQYANITYHMAEYNGFKEYMIHLDIAS